MNKIALLAFVALAGLGVVSANRFDDDDFEGLQVGSQFDDDWDNRQGFGGPGIGSSAGFGGPVGFGGAGNFGRPGIGALGGGLVNSGLGGKPFSRRNFKGFPGKVRRGGIRGGAIGGAAGIGGIHTSGGNLHARDEAGIGGFAGSRTRLGSNALAEGQQSSLIGGEKHFGAGIGSHGSNEADGIHKHKVIDSDQTIIKNSVKGVDDVDGFHTASEHGEGAQIGAGASGFAGQQSSGKLGRKTNFEHDHAIAGAAGRRSELDAGFGQNTAVGAGIAGGAGVGSASL